MSSATRTCRWFDSNRGSLFRLHGNRFSRPVTPRPGFDKQLLVCFLRLAAAPGMSATARPRDALHERPHAENHFRICEDLRNQKARVIGRE
jgi:hypothetical protein